MELISRRIYLEQSPVLIRFICIVYLTFVSGILISCDTSKGSLNDCSRISMVPEDKFDYGSYSFQKRDQVNFCENYKQYSVAETIDKGTTLAFKQLENSCLIHIGIVQPYRISAFEDYPEDSPRLSPDSKRCEKLKSKSLKQVSAFLNSMYGKAKVKEISPLEIVHDFKSLKTKCRN